MLEYVGYVTGKTVSLAYKVSYRPEESHDFVETLLMENADKAFYAYLQQLLTLTKGKKLKEIVQDLINGKLQKFCCWLHKHQDGVTVIPSYGFKEESFYEEMNYFLTVCAPCKLIAYELYLHKLKGLALVFKGDKGYRFGTAG